VGVRPQTYVRLGESAEAIQAKADAFNRSIGQPGGLNAEKLGLPSVFGSKQESPLMKWIGRGAEALVYKKDGMVSQIVQTPRQSWTLRRDSP
jgi:hypothetical protein